MVRKVLLTALFILLVLTIAVQWLYIDYLHEHRQSYLRLNGMLHAIDVLQTTREAADRDTKNRDGRRALLIAQSLEIIRLKKLQQSTGIALNEQGSQLLERVDRYRSPPQAAELLAK
ncbi:hypothetical protein ACNFH5_14790 [Pseudomonas sp. NY15435]|uniref:hypothetical protein n=1 Tax=Pseudomonas sp. NY15435 TaxID=3400358 RepID=UPI003A8C860F